MMSVDDVQKLLDEWKLSQYKEAFAKNQIDGVQLIHMKSGTERKELGKIHAGKNKLGKLTN